MMMRTISILILMSLTLSCGGPTSEKGGASNNGTNNEGTENNTSNSNVQTNNNTSADCPAGEYYHEASDECRSGCLDDSDCGERSRCVTPPEYDTAVCRNADDLDREARELAQCDDATRVLESCGAVVNADDAASLCIEFDSGSAYPEVSECILNWSDGTNCPEELPDCLNGAIECGPNYACSDGSTCNLDGFSARCGD